MSETYKNPVKKIIPSKLETGFQQFLYKYVGKHIPESATPNMITLIGALGGLAAIMFTCLTCISALFFIGTIAGVLIHLVADDLDGYVARNRNMSSRSGAYFDLITDILFSTFLLISLGFTPYLSFETVIFAVPVYAVVNLTAMNYIIYFNEFLFPRLGPIEAHITYVLIAVVGMVFGSKTFIGVFGLNLTLADIIVVIGLIPMYYEMFRLQIQLFRRLSKEERK